MAHRPSDPDGGTGRNRQSKLGTPLWVKLFVIIAVGLALLIGVLLLSGGGDHSPNRHTSSIEYRFHQA